MNDGYYHPQSSWAVDVKLIAEAERVATLETALLTIIKSMNEYLPPSGGDKDRFINEVIGAVDNKAVFRALGGTSEEDSGMVAKALETGR